MIKLEEATFSEYIKVFRVRFASSHCLYMPKNARTSLRLKCEMIFNRIKTRLISAKPSLKFHSLYFFIKNWLHLNPFRLHSHYTVKKFENAARPIVQCTLIRHENAAFQKRFQTLENVWTKNILKTKLFENDGA